MWCSHSDAKVMLSAEPMVSATASKVFDVPRLVVSVSPAAGSGSLHCGPDRAGGSLNALVAWGENNHYVHCGTDWAIGTRNYSQPALLLRRPFLIGGRKPVRPPKSSRPRACCNPQSPQPAAFARVSSASIPRPQAE